jgi:transposase InsO family protein
MMYWITRHPPDVGRFGHCIELGYKPPPGIQAFRRPGFAGTGGEPVLSGAGETDETKGRYVRGSAGDLGSGGLGKWRSRQELALAVFDYIEAFYNPERCHSSVGDLSSVDFEALQTAAATAA